MVAAPRVRVASAGDAPAVARIGRAALPAQYAGLVDPAAVDAAVAQIYADGAVADSISRCADAPDAHFLVAEQEGRVTGFLHFDSFGREPELHRLYVAGDARGAGVGSRLMEALHERLGDEAYMLLVVAGNDRAIGFYERHGLRVAEPVDGLAYYRAHMGVEFPAGARPFTMLLMRRDGARRPARTGSGAAATTVAERLAAALEAGDVDAVAALYADDAVMYHPLAPEGVRGRDAIRDSERELLDAFSRVEVEVRSVLAGARRCAAEIVLRAVNTGPLATGGAAPAPPTGRHVELPAVWWFELGPDGRVVEERDYFDTALLMAQLHSGA